MNGDVTDWNRTQGEFVPFCGTEVALTLSLIMIKPSECFRMLSVVPPILRRSWICIANQENSRSIHQDLSQRMHPPSCPTSPSLWQHEEQCSSQLSLKCCCSWSRRSMTLMMKETKNPSSMTFGRQMQWINKIPRQVAVLATRAATRAHDSRRVRTRAPSKWKARHSFSSLHGSWHMELVGGVKQEGLGWTIG